jgi:hypothetical protein
MMKKICFLFIVLLSGCAAPDPAMISPGVYVVSRTSAAGSVFANMAQLKADTIEAANQFAKAKGKVAVGVSIRDERPIPGFPLVEYQFRLDEPGSVSNSSLTLNKASNITIQRDSKADVLDVNSTPQAPTFLTKGRRALVIGNDSYKAVPSLENAREDARTIASNLTAVGYQVTLKLDLNEKDMKSALRTFANQVEGGDEVMLFFAGHGVQLGAANYLLPTDIIGGSETQVKDEAIQLQRFLDDMSDKKAKFTLAMIDACRDNPFKSSGRAIGGRGLAPTTAATGQMVIFSAGTGQQALDRLGASDKNKNGLFTRIFVQEMQKPNVSIDRVMKNVRNQVAELAKSVGHEQVPAIYDQVLGDFFFKN